MPEYMPRIVDSQLKEKLSRTGAVFVRGPKWCGKTSTCEQLAKSALMLRNPDTYAANLEAAAVRPSLLLRGERPRLLDEWQVAPVLWDAVIAEVDRLHGEPGQFLLTGSATPVDSETVRHTGTGRIARISMDPMTLAEAKQSSKEVSLYRLFDGAQLVEGASKLTVERIAELICVGGWPAPIARGTEDLNIAHDYLEAVCESDLADVVDGAINPSRAWALMRSLARSTAQEASLQTLLQDTKDAGMGMSEPTLRRYLGALERLFVIEDVKAWAPTLRSRTPLRVSPTRHFCDPSLAAAALQASPEALLDDLNTMGYLFESLCMRDLRVYARALGGDVYHYRDKSGLEVDAIVRLENGNWGAIEIKLGGKRRIDEGAANVCALAQRIDTKKVGKPSFLMVLTGGQYAYTRTDGVHVVPLGCLTL